MDPVTGIGLAASVVQLVTFSVDAAHTVRELYKTGSISSYDDVEYTTEHLSTLTLSLQESLRISGTQSGALSKDENDLMSLGRRCEECARKLQQELIKLKPQTHRSMLEAAQTAARAIWKKRKIEEIKRQLESFRSILEISLLKRLGCVLRTQHETH